MKKCALFLILLLLLNACSKEQPETDLSIKQVSFDELEGFDDDDMLSAYNAFQKSCEAVEKKTGEYIDDSEIKINRKDFLKACFDSQYVMPSKFKDFIKKNFTPWQISYKNEPKGKFTAYYEAEIKASNIRDETYKYPIYGRPYDLIEVNLKDFDNNLPSKRLVGRVEGGKLVPYYTRAEIAQKGANAPVILWGDSDIDIYIMQIQGSAVAHLPDGGTMRIAFAESNGYPFKGIGSILLSKGLLDSGKASMGSIKKWLQENPGLAAANMNENQRYIFHRLGNPEGPIGALGVPLTAGRSLAVDKAYVPLGSLLWLETQTPDGLELNKLVMAQDIGSAIKGAVRGDYFWGSGGDDVLEEAGKMNAEGKYYILIPNTTEKVDEQKNK